LERSGRLVGARERFFAAPEAQPVELVVLEGVARIAIAANDLGGAVGHRRIAVAGDSRCATLRFYLDSAFMLAGDLAGVEVNALMLVEHQPKDGGALNLLGMIRKRRGQLSDAIGQALTGVER